MQLIGAVLPWVTSGAVGSDDEGAALRRALTAALREAGRRSPRIAAARHVYMDLASLRPARLGRETAWRGGALAADAVLVTALATVAAQGSLLIRFVIRCGGGDAPPALEASVVLLEVRERWVVERVMVRPFH